MISALTVVLICDKEVIQNDRNNRILDDDSRSLLLCSWPYTFFGRNIDMRGDSDVSESIK